MALGACASVTVGLGAKPRFAPLYAMSITMFQEKKIRSPYVIGKALVVQQIYMDSASKLVVVHSSHPRDE